MDHLWAPWRLSHVAKEATNAPECFICRSLAEANDRHHLIALRTSLSVVVLNRFPYNNGHLLVAPLQHLGDLEQLSEAETLDLQRTLVRLTNVLRRAMKPDGFNVGLNLGKAAGAGLPGHLHWHLVPRWEGDTNFMPIVTDVRVMSQSLDALYDLILDGLAKA